MNAGGGVEAVKGEFKCFDSNIQNSGGCTKEVKKLQLQAPQKKKKSVKSVKNVMMRNGCLRQQFT